MSPFSFKSKMTSHMDHFTWSHNANQICITFNAVTFKSFIQYVISKIYSLHSLLITEYDIRGQWIPYRAHATLSPHMEFTDPASNRNRSLTHCVTNNIRLAYKSIKEWHIRVCRTGISEYKGMVYTIDCWLIFGA